MKLTATIIAGAYRAGPLDHLRGAHRGPVIEQPGDLIVQITAEDLKTNAPWRLILAEMLQEAERSLDRQLKPLYIPIEEPK